MPQQHPKLARACAESIRRWHERYGVERASSGMDRDRFFIYRELVSHFHHADMSDPVTQREIAREQQSRAFEWAYAAPVPVELWNDVARSCEIVDHPPPEHLGAAAQWILRGVESAEPAEPSHEGTLRVTVEAESREQLVEHAGSFYADVVAEQRRGIGGLNLLISCSLERYPWDGERHRRATLLRPEVLGFRVAVPGERRDDFVDALRRGELVVEATTGEPA